MIFTALITIIDGVFVGRGVGPDGIAAVNIIAPIYMVATGIELMLGIEASVLAGMIVFATIFVAWFGRQCARWSTLYPSVKDDVSIKDFFVCFI